MSRCTSERLPGGPGGSGGTDGARGGVHDGSSAAGEWASSSAPTASSSAGWVGAQAVLSRRPGLAPLGAHCRVLPLSLRALPWGLRSLPAAVVAHTAQANRTIAMTTKPARPPPPTSDPLSGALGSGVLLTCRRAGRGWAGPAQAVAGGSESALGAFEEGQT